MNFTFDHVAQTVPNVAGAVAWYREYLGATVLYEDETWGFIEVGGVRLAFVVADQHPNHLAWRVSADELERLAVIYGKAIATHRDGTRSFYLEAPGGTHIEIIHWPDPAVV